MYSFRDLKHFFSRFVNVVDRNINIIYNSTFVVRRVSLFRSYFTNTQLFRLLFAMSPPNAVWSCFLMEHHRLKELAMLRKREGASGIQEGMMTQKEVICVVFILHTNMRRIKRFNFLSGSK